MQMDRNVNPDGVGRYVLLNLRTNKVQWGRVGAEDEFFVLKLKDRNSLPALLAYADSIASQDPQFANEVRQLASRAGCNSQFCKDPD